ncbi:MAG: AI-2E family transporter [Chitinophagales bacterium]|nr:AI-2E family transporter [Chitinophagaceae bacterium]MBP9882052.1 AI-2E family transporter [Chitinophagales bacterium]
MDQENGRNTSYSFEKIVDTIVRLGILYLLINWCFDILQPFIYILIWGIIIAISAYPVYRFLLGKFGGYRVPASLVITLLLLSVLVIPSILLTDSLINGIQYIREIAEQGKPLIPPPNESTKSWPAFLSPVVDFWKMTSENLQATTIKYQSQLLVVGKWLVNALAGAGKGILQFLASILLAGVLLIYSEPAANISKNVFKKLAGNNGENISDSITSTIRSVVKGILGVAFIQTAMAAVGYFVAGVPYAGLWTILSLILAIVQLGVGPIAIPVCIYMFSVLDTFSATMLALWMGIVLVSDNILKPLLLGHGASVPMLVVFLGAIGGFLYIGFLGLFLGAVILTIGYKLFMEWLKTESNQ